MSKLPILPPKLQMAPKFTKKNIPEDDWNVYLHHAFIGSRLFDLKALQNNCCVYGRYIDMQICGIIIPLCLLSMSQH